MVSALKSTPLQQVAFSKPSRTKSCRWKKQAQDKKRAGHNAKRPGTGRNHAGPNHAGRKHTEAANRI